jgi:hypothetical protein
MKTIFTTVTFEGEPSEVREILRELRPDLLGAASDVYRSSAPATSRQAEPTGHGHQDEPAADAKQQAFAQAGWTGFAGGLEPEVPGTGEPSTGPAELTKEMLEAVVQWLEYDGSLDQAHALRSALDHGGFVSREEVYELAGRGPNEILRGFTRPLKRALRSLQERGIIPDDPSLPLPLDARYSEGSGRADGFQVPERWLRAYLAG